MMLRATAMTHNISCFLLHMMIFSLKKPDRRVKCFQFKYFKSLSEPKNTLRCQVGRANSLEEEYMWTFSFILLSEKIIHHLIRFRKMNCRQNCSY